MRVGLFFLSAILLCACGGGGSSSPVTVPTATPTIAPSPKSSATPIPTPTPTTVPGTEIKHVVVIIQENRSLDNLFQGFPNANTRNYGYVANPGGAPTAVTLQMIPLAEICDSDHSHLAWAGDWDYGNMDGFSAASAPVDCNGGIGNNATQRRNPAATQTAPPNYAYSYVNPADIRPYWSMAQNYTLMDNVFEDPTSPSFESHLNLIAGQSNNASENPELNGAVQSIWGCDSPAGTTVALFNGLGDTKPGIAPCFAPPFETIADLLDAKGLTWKYYAPTVGTQGGIWSAFDAVSAVRYGAGWSNVISPETQILSQATNLATVTYVVPSFTNSDHAGSNSATGPSWVADVVNAIGASPNWSNTAIFVLWDDWGGWYDHVPPPVSANYTVGGFRVPVLCISPYSENSNPVSPNVDHTQHGTDGILTFIEQAFNLGSLNEQDAKEAPFNDCFNFKQQPKPFVSVPASAFYPPSYFLRQRPSNIVPDNE